MAGPISVSPASQPDSERFQQGGRNVPVLRGVHFHVTSPRPQRLKPNRFAVGNISFFSVVQLWRHGPAVRPSVAWQPSETCLGNHIGTLLGQVDPCSSPCIPNYYTPQLRKVVLDLHKFHIIGVRAVLIAKRLRYIGHLLLRAMVMLQRIKSKSVIFIHRDCLNNHLKTLGCKDLAFDPSHSAHGALVVVQAAQAARAVHVAPVPLEWREMTPGTSNRWILVNNQWKCHEVS